MENLAAEYARHTDIGRAKGTMPPGSRHLLLRRRGRSRWRRRSRLGLQTSRGRLTTGWNLKYASSSSADIEGDKEGDAYRSKGNEALIIGDWSAFYGTFTGTIIAPNATVIWPV